MGYERIYRGSQGGKTKELKRDRDKRKIIMMMRKGERGKKDYSCWRER